MNARPLAAQQPAPRVARGSAVPNGIDLGPIEARDIAGAPPTIAVAGASVALPAADHHAVHLVCACFGNTSAEALRFARFAVERAGLHWLDEATPKGAAA